MRIYTTVCMMIAVPIALVCLVALFYIWADIALGWNTPDLGDSAAAIEAFRLMPLVSLAAGAVTYYRMQP